MDNTLSFTIGVGIGLIAMGLFIIVVKSIERFADWLDEWIVVWRRNRNG